jgi:ectoine hydroxylase-related dioxygenase (phytanoyl-CoA dioxygenase family)
LFVCHPHVSSFNITNNIINPGAHLPPYGLNVFMPLVDMHEDNGATEFVLGSHNWGAVNCQLNEYLTEMDANNVRYTTLPNGGGDSSGGGGGVRGNGATMAAAAARERAAQSPSTAAASKLERARNAVHSKEMPSTSCAHSEDQRARDAAGLKRDITRAGGVRLKQFLSKKGSVVISDYRTVHRGTVNRSKKPRPVMMSVYGREWWVSFREMRK